MSEKRFLTVKSIDNLYSLIDKEKGGKDQIILMSLHKEDLDNICDLLNEQEETIEELHISDNMGWERAEHFEKELKTKKIYIKRLEYKVQKFKEMNKELKFQLGECTNNKLYSRRELEKENEQLKADEKLYAQEILRLKKELKENQALKLGNDY